MVRKIKKVRQSLILLKKTTTAILHNASSIIIQKKSFIVFIGFFFNYNLHYVKCPSGVFFLRAVAPFTRLPRVLLSASFFLNKKQSTKADFTNHIKWYIFCGFAYVFALFFYLPVLVSLNRRKPKISLLLIFAEVLKVDWRQKINKTDIDFIKVRLNFKVWIYKYFEKLSD